LVEAPSKGCSLFARNFQLDNTEWESIHKQNYVGTTGALISFDGELIDGEELVSLGVFEVNEPDSVVPGLTTVVAPFNWDSCRKELVYSPVLCEHICTLGAANGCNHFIEVGR
jgi:hypothetical protein